MNSYQAKRIPMKQLLASLGHYPVKITSHELWYHSPLHEDKTPSFKVDISRNIWYDHGLGVGGTVIDFGLHYRQTTQVKEVLAWLAKGSYEATPRQILTTNKKSSTLELIKGSISTPNHPNLLSYALGRGIPPEITKTVFKEVRFINHATAKEYYALALRNRQGGYELRNRYFKGAISPKDLTIYTEGQKNILVFEGMFDYASWLTLSGQAVTRLDVIILNSLSFHQHAAKWLQTQNYERIYTFFDNDTAGTKARETFSQCFGTKHQPQNHHYKGFEDLNIYLISNNGQNTFPGLTFKL